ncbi:MAG: flagellar biosynthesis regulator FlaF [Rhodobacteraceae bacterium]|uniref:flagellar biosynthesis regulator FlaF n=1 Tax=Albidovulum sp. TaxID=1872424 RepID=UPI001D426187|nr:flagellar biosynthesis regulator FlaF [uncultured Defluviimonas sp.]MCB2124408.1 flagellar biosynthesis regulator FlaF [Paracoccaceae bacterium]MCC0070605.1 flagellar biosynthesis regulator FlaF [Paracoccaceae bacterium]
MNAHLMARSAYSGAAIPTRTGRGTEYEIFARVTRRLRQAQAGEGGFAALVRALHDNRSLWTALAADVAVEANELPKPLRAQIFYLAQFTNEHSRRVMAGDATVDVLIDINTAVMRGLRGEGEGA